MTDLSSSNVSLRVPRASNLNTLKKIMIVSKDYMKIEDLLECSDVNKWSHLQEYIKLLTTLRWIHYDKNGILLTDKGKKIKSQLDNTDSLTPKDIEIMKLDFLKLSIIRKFILYTFDHDISSRKNKSKICLTKDEIIKKALSGK